MKKGFTILELLVVISVLVILIGIAIPRFKGMQDAARVAQAKGELQTLQAAIESYYMNQTTKAYRATSALVASGKLITSSPQIISVAPYDPFGATATTEYNYTNNGTYYVIWSLGASSTGTASIVTGGTVTAALGAVCATNGTGC